MHTEILKITGMSCGGCVSTVEGALKAVPGVSSAKVSLADHEATVEFSEGQTSHEQLKFAVDKEGSAMRATCCPPQRRCIEWALLCC